jgi:hypothetical protein
MERMKLGRDGAAMRRPISALLATVALTAAGCGGDRASVETLVDGSRAQPRPSALADLEGTVVLTRVRTRTGAELGQDGRECLRSFEPGLRVSGGATVVERTGVMGASLTFRDQRQRFVLGCDRTRMSGENRTTWCGHAAGELIAGRLRDPRLDIGCRTSPDDPIGFVWLEPAARTRWVAVDEVAYSEVYEVASSLPVRVTTSRVNTADSTAKVRVAEYDAGGSVLTTYEVTARVAG